PGIDRSALLVPDCTAADLNIRALAGVVDGQDSMFRDTQIRKRSMGERMAGIQPIHGLRMPAAVSTHCAILQLRVATIKRLSDLLSPSTLHTDHLHHQIVTELDFAVRTPGPRQEVRCAGMFRSLRSLD